MYMCVRVYRVGWQGPGGSCRPRAPSKDVRLLEPPRCPWHTHVRGRSLDNICGQLNTVSSVGLLSPMKMIPNTFTLSMDLPVQISRAAFHPEVPPGGDSASQGTCGSVYRHSWLSRLDRGDLLASRRDVAGPHSKEFPAPDASSAQVERARHTASGVTWHIVSALQAWLHEPSYWL